MNFGGSGGILVKFWVGMMDGGEILGRNASMASQELGRNASMASQESRIGGFSQLVVSGCGAISNFPPKIDFFMIFGDF